MHENVFFFVASIHFWKALDQGFMLLESWGKNKCFVCIFSSIVESKLVVGWVIGIDSSSNIKSRPIVNLGGNSSGIKLQFWEMTICSWIIHLWVNVFSLFGNNSHLKLISIWVLLNEFSKSSRVDTTNKDNIKIPLSYWHRWFLFTTTHSSGLSLNKTLASHFVSLG